MAYGSPRAGDFDRMEDKYREDQESSRWGLVYLAVIVNTIAVFMALWWFSKAFR